MSNVITDYIPIACGFHDRLEHWAVVRDDVEIVWLDGANQRTVRTSVVDVFAKEGADWVQLDTGDVIRADYLVSIEGVPRPDAC